MYMKVGWNTVCFVWKRKMRYSMYFARIANVWKIKFTIFEKGNFETLSTFQNVYLAFQKLNFGKEKQK